MKPYCYLRGEYLESQDQTGAWITGPKDCGGCIGCPWYGFKEPEES